MTEPARAPLYVLTGQGEVEDEIATLEQARNRIQQLVDEVAAKDRHIRSLAHEIGEMKRDHDAEAERHRHWPTAVRLFAKWAEVTGHTRAQWSRLRFAEALPFIQTYGEELIVVAIHGLQHHHYVGKPRANGRRKHHNEWSTLFRDHDRFEDAVSDAPLDMLRDAHVKGLLAKLPKATEVAERFAAQHFDKTANVGDQRTLPLDDGGVQ